MKRILNDERGIALFLVLWVMALLTVIAGEFCYVIRTEVNITRNFKEETQAYYIAKAGVSWAIGELVVNEFVPRAVRSGNIEDESRDTRLKLYADISPVLFGNGQFKVEHENESGKVNLNRAGPLLLKMMLNNFTLDEGDKNIIVDSILDWRDQDDFHRAHGAEDDYYLSLPRPYRCKNDDFTTAEELLLIRGVTPEIFYGGLKDMVSVYQYGETQNKGGIRARENEETQNRGGIRARENGETQKRGGIRPRGEGERQDQGGIGGIQDREKQEAPDFNRLNVNAASPRLLRALPGMTQDTVLEILKYREKKDFRTLAEFFSLVGSDRYTTLSPYITLKPSPYYTIRSTGMLQESRIRQGVQALVKIDRRLEKGYEIIQWFDNLEYKS